MEEYRIQEAKEEAEKEAKQLGERQEAQSDVAGNTMQVDAQTA